MEKKGKSSQRRIANSKKNEQLGISEANVHGREWWVEKESYRVYSD